MDDYNAFLAGMAKSTPKNINEYLAPDGIRRCRVCQQPKIIRMTPDELQMIQQKMQQFGTTNFSAFVRKMAIDGYVVKLELPELKELISLLRYSSNNLNQLTKRVHEIRRFYDADLEELQQSQERLWDATQTILDTLSKL